MDAAQYAIDIAAQMTGAQQTFAELDQLTSGLATAGKNAAHFQDAMSRVSSGLDSAREASALANANLAEGTAEYRELEKTALKAAKAVERASLKGKDNVEANAALTAANDALASQATALKTLESAAAAANTKEAQLVRTLGNLRTMSGHVDRSLSQTSERLSKVQGALGQVGGPVGRLGQLLIAPVKGFQDMSQSMGAAKAGALLAVAGLALVAAAVVALTAALVAGVAAITVWAVKLADTGRSAALTREAFAAARPELAALTDTFFDLTAETGQSEAALRDLHGVLKDARVSAARMPDALRAAALAEAALGKGGSADFVARIKEGKLAVSAFALQAEQSFGGIVSRQMMGLEMQGARLKSNLSGLFGALDIDPALAGLQTLVGLFDKSSVVGGVAKDVFEGIFQPIINQAQNAAYMVEAFVLGFEAGLLKLYIALKPTIKSVKEFFGLDGVSLESVLSAIASAGELLAPVFAAAAVVFGLVAAAVGLAIVGFVALNAAVAAVVAGAGYALAKFAQLVIGSLGVIWSALTGAPNKMNDMGTQMILGLARGISGAAGAVVGAISGAVQGAINSAKRMLGIASPSKVFAGLGEYTGEGFVQGVDAMQGPAQAAVGELVEPPALESPLSRLDSLGGNFGGAQAALATAPAQAPASPNGAASVDLKGAVLNFYGVKDGVDSVIRFGEMLTRALEGDAAALGGEVAPA